MSIFGDASGKELTAAKASYTTDKLLAYMKDEESGIAASLEGSGFAQAMAVTGLSTEVIQDHYAELAVKNYTEYLAKKKAFTDRIKQAVLSTYAATLKMYAEIGYSQQEAEKMAKHAAEETKAIHMKVFKTLFPYSGQKVKQVY
jgi:hypothetical protein